MPRHLLNVGDAEQHPTAAALRMACEKRRCHSLKQFFKKMVSGDRPGILQKTLKFVCEISLRSKSRVHKKSWLILGFEDMANAMELEAMERVKSNPVIEGEHHCELHS